MNENLLPRLDERTRQIERRLDEFAESTKQQLSDIDERLEKHYVTTDSFDPVRTLVYGGVGFTLTAVLTAIVALVLRGDGQ